MLISLPASYGLDQSPTQRVDIYQVEAQRKPSQHEQMRDTILRFLDRMPPAQKALRERLQNIDAEEALRLLDAAGVGGKGNISKVEGNGSGNNPTEGNGDSGPPEPPR